MQTSETLIQKAGEFKDKLGLRRSGDDSEEFAKSIAKGMLAGLIGGLVATAAKSLAERIYPPRTHGESGPPEVLAEKISGHGLNGSATQTAAEGIHWGFGALTGAAYGALAEFYPAARAKEGATFGLTLASLTHHSALPAMGLSPDPEHQTFREQTSEMATHVVYGVVTEVVRSMVRRFLG